MWPLGRIQLDLQTLVLSDAPCLVIACHPTIRTGVTHALCDLFAKDLVMLYAPNEHVRSTIHGVHEKVLCRKQVAVLPNMRWAGTHVPICIDFGRWSHTWVFRDTPTPWRIIGHPNVLPLPATHFIVFDGETFTISTENTNVPWVPPRTQRPPWARREQPA